MNLKMTRIAVGGAKNAVGHIHKTDENESVRVLEGDVNDILVDAELDARALGRSKSVRHVVISPDQELTAEQRNEAIQMIRDELSVEKREAVTPQVIDQKRQRHFRPIGAQRHHAFTEKSSTQTQPEYCTGKFTVLPNLHAMCKSGSV